ncbi:MAG: hypothetical protein IKB44_04090 [Clostridia bacterium]|nr:hypothetical protein [Clostridia bacterium]
MKYDFTDNELELAAKKVLGVVADQNQDGIEKEQSGKLTDIKVLKAKSAVRKRMGRSVRLYAIAAVLIIVMVAGLLIGSADRGIKISYTKQAYMWANQHPESEMNMPVIITVDLEEAGEFYQSYLDVDNMSDTPIILGDIIIKTLGGEVLFEYRDIEFEMFESEKKNYGVYAEGYHYKHKKDENGKVLPFNPIREGFEDRAILKISFSKNWQDFEFAFHPEPLYISETKTGYSVENAIFFTSGANTREEAIETRYKNADPNEYWQVDGKVYW